MNSKTIDSITEGLNVDVVAQRGDERAEFKSVVRKVYTDKKYILIDPIRSDDKLVGFNTKSVIKNIIVNKSPLPILFSNVEMTIVKFEGQMYNKVVILGEGTAVNRRENFRVFVGEGITFKFKSQLEESHAILKDISVGGFALVLNNPNDYAANYQVGEALQFVFNSRAGTTNVSLKIHGVVVRVAHIKRINININLAPFEYTIAESNSVAISAGSCTS